MKKRKIYVYQSNVLQWVYPDEDTEIWVEDDDEPLKQVVLVDPSIRQEIIDLQEMVVDLGIQLGQQERTLRKMGIPPTKPSKPDPVN